MNVDSNVDKAVNELASWALMQNDLENAVNSFNLYLQLDNSGEDNNLITNGKDKRSIVQQSLLFSSIVSYFKCFGKSNGRVVKLDYEDVFIRNKSTIKIHNEMKAFRDKYIAHGDKTEYEHAAVRIVLSPDFNEKKLMHVYFVTRSVVTLHPETVKDYLLAVNTCNDYVETKIK